jgi:hypothetical protein
MALLWAPCGRGVGAEYFRGSSGGCPFESGGGRLSGIRGQPRPARCPHSRWCTGRGVRRPRPRFSSAVATTRRRVRPGDAGAGRGSSAVALRPVPGKVPIGVTVGSRSEPCHRCRVWHTRDVAHLLRVVGSDARTPAGRRDPAFALSGRGCPRPNAPAQRRATSISVTVCRMMPSTVALSGDPSMEVVTAVEDASAEAEAVRAAAQVPPVPEGGHGSAQQLRGLTDGEEVGWLVGGGVGHGCLLGGSGVVGNTPGEGAVSGRLVTPHR